MEVGGDEPRENQEPSGAWEEREEGPRLSFRTDSGGARGRAWFARHGERNRGRDPGLHGGWPSASARRHGLSGGTTGGWSGRRRTSEGNKAHGRTGRSGAGNGEGSLRTRRRSKALKSATPRWSVRARRFGNGRRIGARDRGASRDAGELAPTRRRTPTPVRERGLRESGGWRVRSERQRQEGNGRGDAVRLLASGILRRV